MKFTDLPATDRSNRPLEVENGVVAKVSIDAERCLTAHLHIEFNGGGCAFGGYVLGGRDNNLTTSGKNYAAEFLARCMKVAGVETWEGIAGRPVRVLHEGIGGGIVAVGHFLKDEWFCPRVEFK